jgi:sarcosine oxidase gamma subunit
MPGEIKCVYNKLGFLTATKFYFQEDLRMARKNDSQSEAEASVQAGTEAQVGEVSAQPEAEASVQTGAETQGGEAPAQPEAEANAQTGATPPIGGDAWVVIEKEPAPK